VSRHYARRVDTTHGPIRDALRQVGATVLDTSRLGDGAPDLLVGWRGRTVAVECKTNRSTKEGGRRGETEEQRKLREGWRGDAWIVVRSPDEAVLALVQAVTRVGSVA
jgi:Holliday junction resolvase